MNYHHHYSQKNILAKHLRYKKLSGVCAGIAEHYQLSRIGVRVAAIVALVTFPVIVGVTYVVAAILLPSKR